MSQKLGKRHELIQGLEKVRQMTEELMMRLRDRVVQQVNCVREVLNELPGHTNRDTTELAEGLQRIIRENEERIRSQLELRDCLARVMNTMPPSPFLTEMFGGLMQVKSELVNWLQEENSYIRTLLEELVPNKKRKTKEFLLF